MKIFARFVLAALALAAITPALTAQRGMFQAPELQGMWNPVAGSGGTYQTQTKSGEKSQMDIFLLGKDTVGGKNAYWMEIAMPNPKAPDSSIIIKSLYSFDGTSLETSKVIIQLGGRPPMEIADARLLHAQNHSRRSRQGNERGRRVRHHTRRHFCLRTLAFGRWQRRLAFVAGAALRFGEKQLERWRVPGADQGDHRRERQDRRNAAANHVAVGARAAPDGRTANARRARNKYAWPLPSRTFLGVRDLHLIFRWDGPRLIDFIFSEVSPVSVLCSLGSREASRSGPRRATFA